MWPGQVAMPYSDVSRTLVVAAPLTSYSFVVCWQQRAQCGGAVTVDHNTTVAWESEFPIWKRSPSSVGSSDYRTEREFE